MIVYTLFTAEESSFDLEGRKVDMYGGLYVCNLDFPSVILHSTCVKHVLHTLVRVHTLLGLVNVHTHLSYYHSLQRNSALRHFIKHTSCAF